MKTSDYPVWLAVLHADREAVREAAGRLKTGQSAIAWDKDASLWYARPGCDLSRVEKWLPDNNLRAGGGDAEAQFLDALTQAGLIIKGMPVMDGQRHRVATVEDKNGKKTGGVYRGYLDRRPGGWFINYHRAETAKSVTNWSATGGESDPVASLNIRAAARQSQDDAQRERVQLYTQRTLAAKSLYDRLPGADPEHPYLVRKGITPTPDLRETKNGALVVPFFNATGDFKTLQYITADGDKKLFKDAPKQGHFLVVGGPLEPGKPVLYAEGYATARSLNMATGHPVVMTVDAGNMLAVAKVLHEQLPNSAHTFLADFDHAKDQNKGLLMANAAAELVGGQVLYPVFTDEEKAQGLTDFNDIHQSRGLEALRGVLPPTLIKDYEVPTMQKNNHPEPDTPIPIKRDTPAEPVHTVEPATAVQRRDEEQLAMPLEPALSVPTQDAPTPATAPSDPQPMARVDAGSDQVAAPSVEPASFVQTQPEPALSDASVLNTVPQERGPAIPDGGPLPVVEVHAAPATVQPNVEPTARVDTGSDQVAVPLVEPASFVRAYEDQALGNMTATAQSAIEAGPPIVAPVMNPAPQGQSATPPDVAPLPVAEAGAAPSLTKDAPEPAPSVMPKAVPAAAIPVDDPLESELNTRVMPPPVVGVPAATRLEALDIPAPEPVPQSKKPEPDPQESVPDAIVLGPPRPSGAEVEPQVSNVDKDALLARLSWEKQSDSAVLYKLDGEAAFIDRGSRLEMANGASQNDEMVIAALLTAAQYYRGRIELTGSDEFKAKAIDMIAQHDINVVMKNPVQQAMLDDARKMLGALPVVPNAVVGETPAPFNPSTHAQSASAPGAQPQGGATPNGRSPYVGPIESSTSHQGAVRQSASVQAQPGADNASVQPNTKAPSATAAHTQPQGGHVDASTAHQSAVRQSASVQAQPGVDSASTEPAPAANKKVARPDEASSSGDPSIHQSYKAAEHGVTGKILEFGTAPFRFEKDNTESTYIKLRTKTGIQTFWGKELAGLLRETRVQPGRMVNLQWMGKEPVVVRVPHKNKEGVTIRFDEKEAHRNQWELTVRGNPTVRSGQDEGVKLAAYDANRFAQIQHKLVERLNLNMEVPKPPVDGLYWMTPNGQGSFKSGDELSAPRPGVDAKDAGQSVISSWSKDGHLDMHLVRGDGPYLQGVVRQGREFQHVLVSLPATPEAPSMVFNAITPEGLVPIGSGNGINRSNGEPVSRENIAFKLEGDTAVRIGKLDTPADVPPALHARLGFDERWKEDNTLPKSAPAAAPSHQPSDPRPA